MKLTLPASKVRTEEVREKEQETIVISSGKDKVRDEVEQTAEEKMIEGQTLT